MEKKVKKFWISLSLFSLYTSSFLHLMLDVYQATKSDFTIFRGNKKNKINISPGTLELSHVSFEHLIFLHFLLLRNIFFPFA